jgi:S1-C subfamily serine protease
VLLIVQGVLLYTLWKDQQTTAQQLGASLNTLGQRLETERETRAEIDDMLTSQLGTVNLSIERARNESKAQAVALTSELGTLRESQEEQFKSLQEQIVLNLKSPDFSALVQQVLPAIVSVRTDRSIGSGVIIERDGYLVTNYHVIRGATKAAVRTSDGTSHRVRLVGYDEDKDIAVLHIDGKYKRLPWGDSDRVKVGQRVIALGSPAGLEFTVTEGIVSATKRIADGNEYIQTDVPINPGNSGGPLVDANGDVIGINTRKLAEFEGLGFALTSNEAEDVADPIIEQDRAAIAASQTGP